MSIVNQSGPLVAVVIPMYNVEQYIEAAINSVLQQTYRSFVVICVNDGGSDGSRDIVAAMDDPRIVIVDQENKGLAGARNSGIYFALTCTDAKYVGLLDADDLWLPEKLATHVDHLEAHQQVDISYCPSLFIDEQGEKMGIGQFPKLTNIRSKDILCRNPVGNGSAAFIRSSLLNKVACSSSGREGVPQYFDQRLRQSEDIEFWLRCALDFDAKFEGVAAALTLYRINEGGLSANLDKQYESWECAMSFHRVKHDKFFFKWFELAEAYQFRYLARRAVQSNLPEQARALMGKALKQPKILWEEPKRTLNTLLCTLLLSVSEKGYLWLQNKVLELKQKSVAA